MYSSSCFPLNFSCDRVSRIRKLFSWTPSLWVPVEPSLFGGLNGKRNKGTFWKCECSWLRCRSQGCIRLPKTHWLVHLYSVHFTVRKFYLNKSWAKENKKHCLYCFFIKLYWENVKALLFKRSLQISSIPWDLVRNAVFQALPQHHWIWIFLVRFSGDSYTC